MNKLFRTLLLGGAVCAALSSCTKSDSNDTVIQYPLAGCFAMVADLNDGNVSYYQGVNYETEINVTQATATMSMTGLELPSGVKYPAISLKNLKVGADQGWTAVSAATPAVSVPGFGSVPSFKDFDLHIYDRMIGNLYVPGVMISYIVDGHYKVFSSREGQIVFGTTTSTGPDGNAFKNTEATIGLTFDTKTMKVMVELPGSQFASGMPAQNIVFKDVPFSMNVDGEASFEMAALTPFIGDTPYPQFPISDLKAVYNFKTGLTMNFTCTIGPMPYKVEVTGKY
ncbi:MAG: hypothetical protein K2M06_03675 [Muribaculaceae bacterium]|nr:hypothetical protein [Muribaculaceae bacterium]